MRAIVSIAVAVAFLRCSSGIVSASPLPAFLARDAKPSAISITPHSRLRFWQQRQSLKSGQEAVLYSFAGGMDGDSPTSALIYANGVFYGTTEQGGTNNDGTVFEVTAGGTESVLYSFAGGTDGMYPIADLVFDLNGNLFGTTEAGGEYGDGTIFEVTAGGTEKVLHSFAGGKDGMTPLAGLYTNEDVFFGTTAYGGKNNDGTVFEITPGGKESVLFSFNGKDGANPEADLAYVSGELFGTTAYGGKDNDGTIFEITERGSEFVKHSFTGTDGENPQGALIYNGAKFELYGTTANGGANGAGTVFECKDLRICRVLHSFSGTDGSHPLAGLSFAHGDALYGTTESGGTAGAGTVFKVTTNGVESVLHSFGPGDGKNPFAGLVYASGVLYGTTMSGGANADGTVFELSP